MDESRLVAVQNGKSRSSGYAVGPRLVLASAHGVGLVGQTVRVWRPGHQPHHDAHVVWRGTPEGRDDAALLHIEDPAWQEPAGRAESWGRMATMRPGQQCETWGVPRAIQIPGRPQQRRVPVETMQLVGTVNPGTGYVSNRYFLALADHPLLPAGGDGELPWAGLSGAAVTSGGLLIGVIKAEAPEFGHGLLEIVPAYVLHADETFLKALETHGADSCTLGQAEFDRLRRTDAPGPSIGPLPPGSLLDASRKVVAFHGRDDVLGRLKEWAESPGFGIRLIHGPGGQGKTRLAARLGELLQEDDKRWTVLWPDPEHEDLTGVRDTAVPMLVVLDYAEARRKQLSSLLNAGKQYRGSVPLRVILLARTAGSWWDDARFAPAGDALRRAPVDELPALAPDRETRALVYQQALSSFAGRLADPVGGHPEETWKARAAARPEPSSAALASGNVLTLHMTALADLLDAGLGTGDRPEGGSAPQDGKDPEDRILDHEQLYWMEVARQHDLPNGICRLPVLGEALATVVLLGGAPLDEFDRDLLLRRAPILADLRAHEMSVVRDWIDSVYPSPAGSSWETLQPDRLAERFIGNHLVRNRRLVHTLLAPTGNGRGPEAGISAAQSVRLLTVIARAAAHTPLLGRLDGLLTDVCTRHAGRLGTATMDVATQVERPQPLLEALHRLIENPATPLAELADLADRLPDSSHALADWALRLMERLVEVRTAAGAVSAEDAIALGVDHRRLAKRLLELNRAAEGLKAADRAVELLESLMETDPGAVRFHLAAALNNRAVCLGALGRRSEAIEPALRAVEHYRIVVGGDCVPVEASGQLVRCLTALSDAQRNLGRHGDALRTAEEAVAVQRTFVPDGGPETVSSLAARLNNLAVRHTDLGQYRQAFEAAAEAVDLYEPLAEQYPDAHLNDLSHALGTLSTCYGGLGDREKALELAQRCVDIREGLHRDRPETYRHDLAQGLNSLAIDLGELGHMDRAAAVAERSVELFRTLDGPHGRGRRPELANALNTLANRRADIGDTAGALEAIEQACDIYRELDTELPGVFTADLAMCLGTMASRLEGLGRREDAIALSFEAVELNRRLVPRDPGSIAVYFAAVLHNLRLYLEAAGRTAEALELVDEGLATYADPRAARAVALYPVTAELLRSRAMCLRELGRTDESVAPARELVEIARRMAVLPSGPGPADLVQKLDFLGTIAFVAGHTTESADASVEQAGLLRQLAQVHPQRYEGELADVLGYAKNLLSMVGRTDEAEALAREAVEVRGRIADHGGAAERVRFVAELAGFADALMARLQAAEALAVLDLARQQEAELTAEEADAYRGTLVLAQRVRSQLLEMLGRREEALSCARESVLAAERIAESDPTRTLTLLMAHFSLGSLLVDDRQREESLVHLERAVAICRPLAEAAEPGCEILMASCLGGLGAALALDPAEPERMLKATGEALDICRRLCEADPVRGRGGLAHAAAQHSLGLAEAGRAEEGSGLAVEALCLARELADVDRRVHLFELGEALYAYADVHARAGREAVAASAALDELADLLEIMREDQPSLVEQMTDKIATVRERLPG